MVCFYTIPVVKSVVVCFRPLYIFIVTVKRSPHTAETRPRLDLKTRSRSGQDASKTRLGRVLGASWARLGRVLGPSWARLGRVSGASWARLGCVLGASWARLGRVLGASWTVCGPPIIHVLTPTNNAPTTASLVT